MLYSLKDIIENDKKFDSIHKLLREIESELYEEYEHTIGISNEIIEEIARVEEKLDKLELIVKRKYMEVLKKLESK